MNIKTWIDNNTKSLMGKTVAITGSTGGIGTELCQYFAALGANLILLDRNKSRSEEHERKLKSAYPDINVCCHSVDLEDMDSVKVVTEVLKNKNIDIFIHNAGAYSIPRHKCSTGYDNVFQINFASPYYIIREILPVLRSNGGRAVIVGSIAHNYSHINADDVDFSNVTAASKVYGNAKRYLMFSLFELFKNENNASLSVTHPGITFTNITSHYPKVIFALIKHPMKLIFMPPKIACLSILRGVFESTEHSTWIGPSLFNIWGMPSKKRLNTVAPDEIAKIAEIAEKVYGVCNEED